MIFSASSGNGRWRAFRTPANANSRQSSLSEGEPHHVLVGLRVRLRCVLGKPFTGTKHRFSDLSHMRQCGDDVLWILVTGGPGVRGGADSGDCGQGLRLNATMQSDRMRPPVPTKAAGVALPA